MATKGTKKAVGLTHSNATGLALTDRTRLTPDARTPLTLTDATKRRYKKRAKRCACGCGEMVTPTAQAPHKRFFDDNCRKRYHHRQEAKQRAKMDAPEVELVAAICDFCGAGYFAQKRHEGKYCKPSHRVAAAEHRRDAAVEPLLACMPDQTVAQVKDMIQGMGMTYVTRYLHLQGYSYDESARRWGYAQQPGDLFAQMER